MIKQGSGQGTAWRPVLINMGLLRPSQEDVMSRDVVSVRRLTYSVSPELLLGHSTDIRSDVYALGVILYEMLTLQLPYDGIGGQAGSESFKETYRDSYEAPSVVCGGRGAPAKLWRSIDKYVGTGLQLDVDRRYRNAGEWLDGVNALKRALDEAPELGSLARAAMSLSARLGWLHRRSR